MTAATTMHDLPLKLRVKKILEAQGYHCPLEVALSHFENQDTKQTLKKDLLTDIDVLGIRFEADLRQTIIIADCKSGKVSEANRVFWLRGIMDFFQAQEGIFVKPQAHAQTRAIAPKLGIRILDEKGLQILEKNLGLDSSHFLEGELVLYNKMEKLWGIRLEEKQGLSQNQQDLKSIYSYLQYNYWMIDDYVNIQTIIDRFAKVSHAMPPNELKSKYLAFIGLQRLSLSIIKMTSYVAAQDLNDVARLFRIAFFGGTYQMRKSKTIIAYLDHLSDLNRIGEKLDLEPPYFSELVEIVNRIVLNSRYAIEILRHLDLVITQQLFGSNQEFENVLGHPYSTEALVLMKRIAAMFVKYTKLQESIFENLWNL